MQCETFHNDENFDEIEESSEENRDNVEVNENLTQNYFFELGPETPKKIF